MAIDNKKLQSEKRDDVPANLELKSSLELQNSNGTVATANKQEVEEDVKLPSLDIKKPVWFVVCILVAVLIGGNIYFFLQNKQLTTSITADKKEADKKEAQDIYKKISKFMELPKEDPVLATVIDKSKLLDQPFFAKAENGDKVLVFSQARKALIYRPKNMKVIEYSPLSFGQAGNEQVDEATELTTSNFTTTPIPTTPVSTRSATSTQ